MIQETEISHSAPRLDRCLWVIVRDTKKAYVQANYRTKRSSCSREKPWRKLAENVENVQIFPYACFIWLFCQQAHFCIGDLPPHPFFLIRIWVLLEAVTWGKRLAHDATRHLWNVPALLMTSPTQPNCPIWNGSVHGRFWDFQRSLFYKLDHKSTENCCQVPRTLHPIPHSYQYGPWCYVA